MTEILIRLVSPSGRSRITIALESTIADLLSIISKKTSLDVDNIKISFDNKEFGKMPFDTKIGSIPQMEDGVQLFARPVVKEEIIREDKPEENPFIKKEDPINDSKVGTNKKCTHGPNGRCINCMSNEPVKPTESDKKEEEEEKYITTEDKKCAHGPNGKCINCISEENTDVKHLSFDLFIDKNFAKCKNHNADQKCSNCLVDLDQDYKVKMDCKNHEPYPKGMCSKCIPPLVNVARQEYRHVDYASFMNYKETQGFIRYWLEHINQRVGQVYGYYAEDPVYPKGVRAVVEAIYEPPQESGFNEGIVLDDPFEVHVSMLADALGLERIGWLFTTYHKDMFLSSQELLEAAKRQEMFKVRHPIGLDVSKQITIVLRCDQEKNNQVTPEVYMVSDQGLSLVRDGLVGEPEDRKHLKIKEQKDNRFQTKFFYQKKMVDKIDPDFFIVNVAHGEPRNTNHNILDNTGFTPANRLIHPTPQELKKYINDRRHLKSYQRYANFHVLLYLAKMFDIHTAMTIAENVRNQTEVPGYLEELIDSYLMNA